MREPTTKTGKATFDDVRDGRDDVDFVWSEQLADIEDEAKTQVVERLTKKARDWHHGHRHPSRWDNCEEPYCVAFWRLLRDPEPTP